METDSPRVEKECLNVDPGGADPRKSRAEWRDIDCDAGRIDDDCAIVNAELDRVRGDMKAVLGGARQMDNQAYHMDVNPDMIGVSSRRRHSPRIPLYSRARFRREKGPHGRVDGGSL